MHGGRFSNLFMRSNEEQRIDNNMKILVVIPARGGSKGIPGKNIRLLHGKPLIAYGIENARSLKASFDVDVVVDTDDEEIIRIAQDYQVEVARRPEELAGDAVPLDPVIFHAYQMMKEEHGEYDVILTMQPTSPTLKAETIKKALDYFLSHPVDTLISGVNEPHLSWSVEEGKTVPNYTERKNRQYLPKHLKETGGFLIAARSAVTEKTRIGERVEVYEVPAKEAIDIDTYEDWSLCESILQTKRILLRADGEEQLGMGHIYRTLSLAYHLTGHEIMFVTRKDCEMGRKKLEASFFPLRTIEKEEELLRILEEFRPDIMVNDILNTDEAYMEKIKERVPRVVNFEDKGKGAALADAVINALYSERERQNEYAGFRYFFIRDEFLTAKPKAFSEEVKEIVVLFGGTDPTDMTRRIYRIFQEIATERGELRFHIITGFGYRFKDVIKDDEAHHIYVHNDVKSVSSYLAKSDMAITAQGRTIYELACMGVPAIVLAQNPRELEHDFAGFSNGFINLGLGSEVEDAAIRSTIEWLIDSPSIRRQMHQLLLEKDFTSGQNRVIRLVLGKEE